MFEGVVRYSMFEGECRSLFAGQPVRYAFNEADHPRDESGRFTDIGGLEYKVEKHGDFAVKTPRSALINPKAYALRANHLDGLVPETILLDGDSESPKLAQKWVNGREATQAEVDDLEAKIRARGIIPRDLTTKNVIVDSAGKSWAIDPGNFEVDFDHPGAKNWGGLPAAKKRSSADLQR